MSKRPKAPPDVKTMDPRRRLLGADRRETVNSDRSTAEKLRLGGQYDAEQDEWRARFYFSPGVASRLRSATEAALGRRLGGGR